VRFTSFRTLLGGAASFLALVASVSVSMAAHQNVPEHEPKAKERFLEVIKSYKDLKSYSDHGKFALKLTDNGKLQDQSSPLELRFERPNKLYLNAGLVQLASDGKKLTTSVEPFKQYTEVEAPKNVTLETFQAGPAGSAIFGGPTGPPMLILTNLLVGEDPLKTIEELDCALKVSKEDKDEVSILLDRKEQNDFELIIDPKTNLLKKINLVIGEDILARLNAGGRKLSVDQFGWLAGEVSTDAPAADAFAFVPPADFKKVDEFGKGTGGVEPADVVAKRMVGKPAPDFSLTVVDGEKTKTVTKADLAGKVVMIDFWATWCPPCVQSLPDVQKMVDAFEKDGKNVVVVSLSQDGDPDDKDLGEIRQRIEKTFAEKKVKLHENKVVMLALDPEQTVGAAFNVEAIPSLFILDGKGVVQAAYVGAQEVEVLTKDIDTLLSGKSLVEEKPEEAEASKK